MLKASNIMYHADMACVKIIDNIRSFNRFYTNVLVLFDRHFLKSAFPFTEVRILYEIYHDPDSSVCKIRNTLGIDEGYLSRSIDRRVQKGLVIKLQSEKDRRRFILSLTAAGKNKYRKLSQQSAASIDRLIEHLDPDEIQEIESSMLRIQQLLGKHGKANHVT